MTLHAFVSANNVGRAVLAGTQIDMSEDPAGLTLNEDGTVTKKLNALRDLLSDLGSVVVAYSGGTDSTLLLKVAHEELVQRAMAVTAVSPTLTREEMGHAAHLAAEIGAEHLLIESDELDSPDYVANSPDRCYYCKHLRFDTLRRLAQERGFAHVLDGTNVDDQGDHRPGMRAARELGVRSPLQEVGFTKADIRAASRSLGLPNWNEPSNACLASRIPYGTPITRERLQQIEEAERLLRELGFAQLRVRAHSDIARIEVPAESLPDVLGNRDLIVDQLRKLGFSYVALDLEGYRTGSMNETLVNTNGE
jgi:uncharacterized protein